MQHLVRDVCHRVRVRIDDYESAHGRRYASLSIAAAEALPPPSASLSSFSPSFRAVIRVDFFASAALIQSRSSSGHGKLMDQSPSVGDAASFVSLALSPVIAASS